MLTTAVFKAEGEELVVVLQVFEPEVSKEFMFKVVFREQQKLMFIQIFGYHRLNPVILSLLHLCLCLQELLGQVAVVLQLAEVLEAVAVVQVTIATTDTSIVNATDVVSDQSFEATSGVITLSYLLKTQDLVLQKQAITTTYIVGTCHHVDQVVDGSNSFKDVAASLVDHDLEG